ncbi:MAG: hypothetical protein ABGZ17_00890, partial [Planctomycetaceae bacterium]
IALEVDWRQALIFTAVRSRPVERNRQGNAVERRLTPGNCGDEASQMCQGRLTNHTALPTVHVCASHNMADTDSTIHQT